MTTLRNLLDDALPPTEGERFDTLLARRNVVIERIVSGALIRPSNYVQDQDEWVVLLKGEATLEVDGQTMKLQAGDSLYLPAHTPHTVLQTSYGTTWLAVHIHAHIHAQIRAPEATTPPDTPDL